jgi:serine/threonine-protein kinase RsbW
MCSLVAVREKLSESYPATPQTVAVVRRSVVDLARALGIRGSKLDDVRLAVSEAVTNVVLHAYPSGTGLVHVTAQAADDELWVLIADDGAGHNIPSKRPGLGWGLALITKSCDEFTLVERASGGSEARMCFRIPASQNVSSYSQNVSS